MLHQLFLPLIHHSRTLAVVSLSIALAACQSNSVTPTPSAGPVIATNANINKTESTMRQQAVSEVIAPASEPLDNLWDRITVGFKLQDQYEHPDVQNQIQRYASNQRLFDLVAERAAPFLFSIVEEIEQRGLPLELALLPIVESTFDPRAASQEYAVGLWQFIPATAASFGLQQDWWYDARRDPFAATPAALDYLQSLEQMFNNDWLLAIAAYNTGEGNVRRALQRSNKGNFWGLRLPRETRSHVPRLLALAAIVAAPEHFGIELPKIPNANPVNKINIDAQIDLSRAADLAGLTSEHLKSLNPGYRQWATHPDAPQYIYLPATAADDFIVALAQLDPHQFVTWDRYEIQPGDTLGGIARKLGTGIDVLQQANNLQGTRIVAGKSLLIPRSGSYSIDSIPVIADTSAPSVPQTYTVRRGDNLWSIANRYQLYSADIVRWNNLSPDPLLMPGQVLDFSFANSPLPETEVAVVSDTAHYLVRRGDSLYTIARYFETDIDQLLRLNDLASSDVIYPGQKIRIKPNSARE